MSAGNAEHRHGFTLTELMVASFISVLVIGGAMGMFIHGLQIWDQEQVVNELNYDLEKAMEMIRNDLRLSSIGVGLMSFFPTGSVDYIAVSIPRAEDTDGDGFLDRDADGKIIWNKTVIYHVRPGSPDKLMRTTYSPRYSNSTPEQIYQQLCDVVAAATHADLVAAAMSGESVATRTVFENLVDLQFHPPGSSYDCYAATMEKDESPYNWGSIVIDGGNHEVTLTVEDKNPSSTGYKVYIDRIMLSASASPREAEIFTPINSHPVAPYYKYVAGPGTTVSANDFSSYSALWSGKCGMVFDGPPMGIGVNSITFTIYNDLWCDTNFKDPGGTVASNVSVKYDRSFETADPFIPDYAVSMDKGTIWTASSGGDAVTAGDYEALTTITNVIYGGTNDSAMIIGNGVWARLWFEREVGKSLLVTNAVIVDAGALTASNVTFNGGTNFVFVPTNGTIATNSDWIPMWEINKDSNYFVGFQTFKKTADEDLDMFIGNRDPGTMRFYENTGSTSAPAWGAGVQPWQGINVGQLAAPAFADFDADGDYDLLVGAGDGQVRAYTNSGDSKTPVMTLYSASFKGIAMGGYATPTFVDIDGDSDQDVICGGWNGNFVYCRNTGTVANPLYASPLAGVWPGFVTNVTWYSAPEFADIDADGDFDMFSGDYYGSIWYWMNTGSATNPVFAFVTTNYFSLQHSWLSTPRFTDIDSDGDLDLFTGAWDGKIHYLQNTGAPTNAIFGAPVILAPSVGVRSAPAFVNIDADVVGINGPACWQSTGGDVMSYQNGVTSSVIVGLSRIEVGYPAQGIFRSGVFDTGMATPVFNQLNWTQYEDSPDGDVDIRIRSGDLSDCSDGNWQDAHFADDGYFQDNSGNSLATLPSKRYAQYEALLQCGDSGASPSAHTNSASAVLRDVTIDWEGPTGLVDLQTDFGRGPEGGIVSATVDGQELVKGINVEMEIYKTSRTGTNTVSGILEVRPLNTGR